MSVLHLSLPGGDADRGATQLFQGESRARRWRGAVFGCALHSTQQSELQCPHCKNPCGREGALRALICPVARHNIIISSFNGLRTDCFLHQFLCLLSPDSATAAGGRQRGCSNSVFPLTLPLFARPWLLRSLGEALIDPSRWHRQAGVVIW